MHKPSAARAHDRLATAALVFAFATTIGVLFFGYRYLDDLTRGHQGTLIMRLMEELTAAYSTALLFPGIVWVARRWQLGRTQRWLVSLPMHLLAAAMYSVLHTTLTALARNLIAPLVGLGSLDYGLFWIRYFIELPNDVLWYALIVGFVHLFNHYRASRDSELHTAQLQSRLAEAQLQNLRLQIHPHFLFNVLNTISSVMYDDPRAADAMVGQLAELLRRTLRAPSAQETTLEEELHLLQLYLGIMRARFEERLAVRVEVAPGLERALVPQLILQPLVENAIHHGFNATTARGDIEVRCARENGSLILEVRDHGPGLSGFAEPPTHEGIGLSNTAHRLQLLYGAAQRFELHNAVGGGLQVVIVIPYRNAPAGVESE